MKTKLLHGTTTARLAAILAEGLRPGSCLTCDETVADYYAGCAAEEEGGEPVVLMAEVPVAALRVDWPSFEEPLTYYRNERAGSEEEWHATVQAPSGDEDIWTALDVTWCVRCVDPVLPDDIAELDASYERESWREVLQSRSPAP